MPWSIERRLAHLERIRRERIKWVISTRAKQYWRNYGLLEERAYEMMVRQDFRCAVCPTRFSTDEFKLDHSHDTGEPRGFLCNDCNTLEGMIRKTGLPLSELFDRLARYLGGSPH